MDFIDKLLKRDEEPNPYSNNNNYGLIQDFKIP